jgi:hypothetical protein
LGGAALESVFLAEAAQNRRLPVLLVLRLLHIESMLQFVKNWVNCKILGLLFSHVQPRLALCGETLRQ